VSDDGWEIVTAMGQRTSDRGFKIGGCWRFSFNFLTGGCVKGFACATTTNVVINGTNLMKNLIGDELKIDQIVD
jgi:hypothetical protein